MALLNEERGLILAPNAPARKLGFLPEQEIRFYALSMIGYRSVREPGLRPIHRFIRMLRRHLLIQRHTQAWPHRQLRVTVVHHHRAAVEKILHPWIFVYRRFLNRA